MTDALTKVVIDTRSNVLKLQDRFKLTDREIKYLSTYYAIGFTVDDVNTLYHMMTLIYTNLSPLQYFDDENLYNQLNYFVGDDTGVFWCDSMSNAIMIKNHYISYNWEVITCIDEYSSSQDRKYLVLTKLDR
jgi:hypothetical protein